jgi:hypothetical protein
MSQKLLPVGPPAVKTCETPQGRNFHFIDEMTKEGRLREDLGIHERRFRLQWHGRQLFKPMKPAGRVHVL